MSLMSAAEAGQAGGTGPDLPVPRRRLRAAAPAAGGAREDGPDSPPGAGAPWSQGSDAGRPMTGAAEMRSTELHVREVRVVRRASVRAVRAGGSRLIPAQARPEPGLAGMVAQRRIATTQARSATYERAAAGSRAVTRARVASQSRVVAQTRAVARTPAPGRRAQRPGAIRLTRRGRRLVAGFAMVLVIVGATLIWMTAAGSVQASSRGGGAAPASPYQGMTQVVVRPGQTLWSIAAAAEPSAGSWDVVQQIMEVNALNGATVHAGQLLWVPKG